MSELIMYRCHWLDGAGMAVVQKRHEGKVFGFWPIYRWESVAHFPSRADGIRWIIDEPPVSTHNPEKEE